MTDKNLRAKARRQAAMALFELIYAKEFLQARRTECIGTCCRCKCLQTIFWLSLCMHVLFTATLTHAKVVAILATAIGTDRGVNQFFFGCSSGVKRDEANDDEQQFKSHDGKECCSALSASGVLLVVCFLVTTPIDAAACLSSSLTSNVATSAVLIASCRYKRHALTPWPHFLIATFAPN